MMEVFLDDQHGFLHIPDEQKAQVYNARTALNSRSQIISCLCLERQSTKYFISIGKLSLHSVISMIKIFYYTI